MRRTILLCVCLAACKTGPSELSPEPTPTTTTTAATTTQAVPTPPSTPQRERLEAPPAGKGGPDPLDGKFTIADATKDLPGKGPLVAKIETSKGTLQCKLLDDKAPNTVANFIGLATGKRPWKDPRTNEWVKKPAYDGTTFHRIIKGFMIQGGDPLGSGRGEPGYVIKDELWTGAKHDRAGLLCMANRGHDTNGAQFFITDDAAAHLDGNYTIFGECAPVETVHEIANVPVAGERPRETVTIKTVTISRDADTKKK
jgi:peptidyl-prolyl cis-trans isomerase A (cyclophilin A)